MTDLPSNPEQLDQAVLGALTEEIGEVFQAASVLLETAGKIQQTIGKILRHGPQAVDTHVLKDGKVYDNIRDLSIECGQVAGAIDYAVARGLLNGAQMRNARSEKFETLKRIHGGPTQPCEQCKSPISVHAVSPSELFCSAECLAKYETAEQVAYIAPDQR